MVFTSCKSMLVAVVASLFLVCVCAIKGEHIAEEQVELQGFSGNLAVMNGWKGVIDFDLKVYLPQKQWMVKISDELSVTVNEINLKHIVNTKPFVEAESVSDENIGMPIDSFSDDENIGMPLY